MPNLNNFEVVGGMPLGDIEAGLRASPLLNQRDFFPFANADISFEWVTEAEVLPMSLVAVERKLERQGLISADMKNSVGFDQYELEEGGVMLDGGPEGTTGVIPPVIVDAESLDGTNKLGVLDGLHRAIDCFRVQGRGRLLVALITGAASDWQAYANTNGWSEVQVLEEKPEDKRLWKHYKGDPLKNEEYGSYVDFSHLNGSRPYVRGQGDDTSS